METKAKAKPKELTKSQKARIAQATPEEVFMAVAQDQVVRQSKAMGGDAGHQKAALKALDISIHDPKRFAKLQKAAKQQQKALGNGLPRDCFPIFFDVECIAQSDERGGFLDAHIIQFAAKPWACEPESQTRSSTHFDRNVNPCLDWERIRPELRRYAQTAWDCRGMDACAVKAATLPDFRAVFRDFTDYLVKQAHPSKNILLIGFNSANSDRVVLATEMQRYKLKWPKEITVWLWDCAPVLRKKLNPGSKKWSLALLYNIAFKKSMAENHKAYPDTCNLRDLVLRVFKDYTPDKTCELLSMEAFSVMCLHDSRRDAARKLHQKRLKGDDAAKFLTVEQSEALDFSEKSIKEGVVKGLGRKNAARLRLQHCAKTFMDLFQKYETDDQFTTEILRKGAQGSNMAKEAEAKLLVYAQRIHQVRSRVKERDDAKAKVKSNAKAQQQQLYDTHQAFLVDVQQMFRDLAQPHRPTLQELKKWRNPETQGQLAAILKPLLPSNPKDTDKDAPLSTADFDV